MANKPNARKALRQAITRTARNKTVRDGIVYLRRQYKRALEQGDKTAAAAAFTKVQVALDRAAEKGVLKNNTASRLKSRAAKKLRTMA